MQGILHALLLAAIHVAAYTPAQPTNDTNAVNQTDLSMLDMRWYPAGDYSNSISYQLARSESQGFVQGAVVHFSEKNLSDQNTTTPWIALVNCDRNTSNASQEVDIFTLARDRGAAGALLYSLTSEACLINYEYANSPDDFAQILDIFATKSKATAQIIDSQFANLHNASLGFFDATQLNNSADAIMSSLTTGNTTSSFIIATLRAANSTVSPNGTDQSSGTDATSDPPGNPNTGLAMIILYAITGCVSALFIVVILSGAIRAIRHPERYGPRAAGANGNPDAAAQSRTAGIGRAILDTFPIIKFGQTAGDEVVEPKRPDLESQPPSIELDVRGGTAEHSSGERIASPSLGADPGGSELVTASSPTAKVVEERAASPRSSDPSAQNVETTLATDEVRSDAIGHETCPICIVDFQEGDDLRVLPCEGKHKFHQTCVDPWLLELSSSCPLCREDFHALESMIARNDSPDAEHSAASGDNTHAQSAASSRFSKYLRFARRRNHSGLAPPAMPPADEPG